MPPPNFLLTVSQAEFPGDFLSMTQFVTVVWFGIYRSVNILIIESLGGVSVTVLLDQRTLQNREQCVKRKLIFVFTNLEVSRKNTSFLLDYTLF